MDRPAKTVAATSITEESVDSSQGCGMPKYCNASNKPDTNKGNAVSHHLILRLPSRRKKITGNKPIYARLTIHKTKAEALMMWLLKFVNAKEWTMAESTNAQ